MPRPLCFVLMPFGSKPDAGGAIVDFDAVYRDLIAPAISEAGLEPLRADEEMDGRHHPQADVRAAAPVRIRGRRPHLGQRQRVLRARRSPCGATAKTVLLFAEGGSRLPFDVAMLRALPYRLRLDGKPAERRGCQESADARLGAAQAQTQHRQPAVPASSTASRGSRPREDRRVPRQVALLGRGEEAAGCGAQAGTRGGAAVEHTSVPARDVEAGVLIDLFLSYRAVKAWHGHDRPRRRDARRSRQRRMVQEQLGFALNRAGRSDEAEPVLRA